MNYFEEKYTLPFGRVNALSFNNKFYNYPNLKTHIIMIGLVFSLVMH